MTAEHFLSKLREYIAGLEGMSLSVADNQPCPKFEIRSSLRNTAKIHGYYCELGDSFIQVSSSGREEFTNNDESANRFLALIKDIVGVLANHGCDEKQWITPNGEVKRSTIELRLPGRPRLYSLGKKPGFSRGNLRLVEKHFLPLL